MRISGFSFARNATVLDDPLEEALRSILPVVDLTAAGHPDSLRRTTHRDRSRDGPVDTGATSAPLSAVPVGAKSRGGLRACRKMSRGTRHLPPSGAVLPPGFR